MGDIRTAANAAYRDHNIPGVPTSGDSEPVKPDIRSLFGIVEDAIEVVSGAQIAGLIGYATLAAMEADLTRPDRTVARVAENASYYIWDDAANDWVGPGADPLAVAQRMAAVRRALPSAIDWTDRTQWAAAWPVAAAANLDRFNMSGAGGELAITRSNNGDWILGTTLVAFDDDARGVEIDGTGKKAAGALAANYDAFCLAFPDVLQGAWGAASRFLAWRADGVITFYDNLNQVAGSPVIDYDRPLASGVPVAMTWVAGDVLRIRYRALGGGRGTASFYKNGLYLATYDIAENDFTMAGVAWRTTYSVGADYRASASFGRRDLSAFDTVHLHENPALPDDDTCDGSEANPYRRLTTASDRLESHGERLRLLIRSEDDEPIRGVVQCWSNRFKDLEIVADSGFTPRLYASRKPVWTQPNAALYPNVWQTATRIRGVEGVTNPIGAIFDLTSVPTGNDPFVWIEPAANDTAIAAMNGGGQAGTYSIHTAGTYAGKILAHFPGGVNPAGLDLEVPEWFASVYCVPRNAWDDADRYGMRLTIGDNIVFGFGVEANVWLNRLDMDIGAVTMIGAAGSDCLHTINVGGRLRSPTFIGPRNDGANFNYVATGGFPSQVGADGIAHRIRVEGFYTEGAKVGDGLSNHSGVHADVDGGRTKGCNKHGLSMAESFTARNVVIEGAENGGIYFAPSRAGTAEAILGVVQNCLMRGSVDVGTAGLNIEAAAGVRAKLIALDNTIRDNPRAVNVINNVANTADKCTLEHGGNRVGGNASNAITPTGAASTITAISGAPL
ncbi:MAG: hypothetical protein EON89_00850 [Brevundimonas sp.]|nr:MAG: hypothetical protein EON89_00850 [Brevundimonas sp.]